MHNTLSVPTIKNVDTLLDRSKSMLLVTDKILSHKKALIEKNEPWMKKLWVWADRHHIHTNKLPRNPHKLFQLKVLGLWGKELTQLPKEIAQLTNLRKLDLGDNQLTHLPKEITQLCNLELINLTNNPNLQLTKEQQLWVEGILEEYDTTQKHLDSDNRQF